MDNSGKIFNSPYMTYGGDIMNKEKLEKGDLVKNRKHGNIVVDEVFRSPNHGIRIKGHKYDRWKRKDIIVDFDECEVM